MLNFHLNSLQDKTILITGGTGSFGTTMVHYLLDQGCNEIRIFSRDELKQEEMRIRLANPRLKFYIGDVRSFHSINQAMKDVHLVFHAAAMKQVPSCEFFPMQAVETNVLGSCNVIESAIQNGVEGCVCLSTDKAIHPVNSMGMTKALMEKVAQAAARRLSENETRICCVRYGNVLYSRGSVIPLFVRQIMERRPITVTDPRMTRFLLPLIDSIELVHFAFSNARQGDIFVKKAPACSIERLVAALKCLFQSDMPVHRIGTRHGEKLHEILVSAEELRRSDDLGKFFRIKMDQRELDYSKYLEEGDPELDATLDYSSDSTMQLSVDELSMILQQIPEVRAAMFAVR
jgi:UDP-N-acetylglucosamine 4,6-dehydratase/5-epimerase